MSVRVMAAVWRLDLESTPKFVLLKLADCADDQGNNAFPGVAAISRECGMHERTVQRTLRELERAGLIVVQRPADKGRKLATTYRVVPDAITGDKMPPHLAPPREVASDPSEVALDPITPGTRPPLPSRSTKDPSSVRGSRARAKTPTKRKTIGSKATKTRAIMSLDEKLARDAVHELVGTIKNWVSEKITGEMARGPNRGAWIVRAAQIATEENKRSWSYIEAILRRWEAEGFDAPLRRDSERRAVGRDAGRQGGGGRNGRAGQPEPLFPSSR